MGLGTHIRHHVAATTPLTAALVWSRGWGERAQERARRNAMVATNELMARRQEREDVDEFLVRAHARHHAAAGHRHQAHRQDHRAPHTRHAAPPVPSEQHPAAAQG
ncbi:MAG: hypothetical protein Q8Q02_15360 [Nocardioides sp.]|nr:hypothetical protein [Nocardioides sp.]